MGKYIRSQLKGRQTIYTNRYKKKLLRVDNLREVVQGAITQDFCRHPLTGKPLARVRNPDGRVLLLPAIKRQSVGHRYGENLQVMIRRIEAVPEGTTVCAISGVSRPYTALTAPGSKGVIVAKKAESVTVRIGKRLATFTDALCILGTIGGGEAHEKPLLKAGVASRIARARLKKYPTVSSHKMNILDHPLGGSHRKKRGKPMTVSKRSSPGAKYGNIGASRTGHK